MSLKLLLSSEHVPATDIFIHITHFLDGRDLSKLSATCRKLFFFYLSNKLILWKRLLQISNPNHKPQYLLDFDHSSSTVKLARRKYGDLAEILTNSISPEAGSSAPAVTLETETDDEEEAEAWKFLYLKHLAFSEDLWNQLNEHVTRQKPIVSYVAAIKTEFPMSCMVTLPKFSKPPGGSSRVASTSKQINWTPKEQETHQMLTNSDTYLIYGSRQASGYTFSIVNATSAQKNVIRTFSGHQASVLDVQPLCHNPYLLPLRTTTFSPGSPTHAGADILTKVQLFEKEGSSLFNHRLISSSSDTTLKIWNLKTGDCLSTLNGHTGAVYSVRCSEDLLHAFSASYDQTINMWDLSTSKSITTIKAHDGAVYTLRYDGYNALFSASKDGTVKMWDVRSKQDLKPISSYLHQYTDAETNKTFNSPVYAMDLQGYKLYTGDKKGTARIFDLRKGAQTITAFSTTYSTIQTKGSSITTKEEILDSPITCLKVDEVKCIVCSTPVIYGNQMKQTPAILVYQAYGGVFEKVREINQDVIRGTDTCFEMTDHELFVGGSTCVKFKK